MAMLPVSLARVSSEKMSATSPISLWKVMTSPSEEAIPALSCPRCWSAYSPRQVRFAASAWPYTPNIPHSSCISGNTSVSPFLKKPGAFPRPSDQALAISPATTRAALKTLEVLPTANALLFHCNTELSDGSRKGVFPDPTAFPSPPNENRRLAGPHSEHAVEYGVDVPQVILHVEQFPELLASQP